MSVKTLILTELLNCGYADIDLLGDIDEDILIETLEAIKQEDCSLLEFNIIVEYCFIRVVNDINNYLIEKFDTKKYQLLEGFSSFHNYMDTHAYLNIEKVGIQEDEQKVIGIIQELFEDKTGFSLSVQ